MTGDPHRLRFFAGVAVSAEDGSPLGALCVMDREPRTMDDLQRDALRNLAVQASTQIGQLATIAGLRRISEARERATELALDQAGLLQSVLDNAPDVVCVLEHDGFIRFASASATAMLDLDPDAWVGRSAFDLIHPDDIPRAVRALTETASSSAPTTPVKVRLKSGSGDWKLLEITASSLPSEHATAGVVVSLRDIGRWTEDPHFGDL